jgi:uncharacterized membrane protein YbhN (UPF0104 family)
MTFGMPDIPLALVQLDILSDITGWFGDVWDQIRAVDVQYLLIGCALQTAQTTLNGLAWRNILAKSYGRENVPVRPIIASYAGGLGLNSFLPAQAGTFAYLGMFRAIIPGSAFAGILAGGVVQNLFFGLVGGLNYLYLFLTREGSAGKSADQATADGGPKVVFLVLAALLLVIVGRVLWKRYRRVWEDAKEGAAILRSPRVYATRVLALQVVSYGARIGVNANFMYAFGIPVTLRNVFLIIAANSVSSTFAVTPGGVGTQQAMASFALRDVAPASTVTAYSLAQQMILIAWNITFGLVAMASTFGWSATKDMIGESRRKSKEKRSLSDLEKEEEAPCSAPR